MKRQIRDGVKVTFDYKQMTREGLWIDTVHDQTGTMAVIISDNKPLLISFDHISEISAPDSVASEVPSLIDELGRSFAETNHAFTKRQRDAYDRLNQAVGNLR